MKPLNIITKNIQVQDTAFDPVSTEKNVINFFQGLDKKTMYKVWIYLEGPDVYYVDWVEYELHETFPDRFKRIERSVSNPNCTLVIWTWGVFNLKAKIFLKTGEVINAEHLLTYDRFLKRKDVKFKNTSGRLL